MIKFNSLKAKIITLLTATTLTIAFLLFYIFINFYKKDKVAYIFENNAAALETVGEQFRREVEFSSEIIKVHLENTKRNKKLALSSENYLPDDYLIDSMAVYQKTPQFKVVDRLFKKTNKEFSEADVHRLIDAQASNNEQTVYVDDVTVTVVTGFTTSQSNWALIYQFQSTTLRDHFKAADTINTALITKNSTQEIGKFKYPESDATETEKINQDIISNVAPLLTQNALTNMITLDDKKYLFSSSRLYQTKSYLSSFVSEEKVFENLQSLMIRSLFFLILISSLVVLLSYFSSDYLTHRLKKLTQSAKRIADGQFDEKIQDTGHDEISTLTSGFNQMSTEISRLLHETANKARMESELKTAQIVQSTLFPKNEYESSFIQIKGFYNSASECGGDWWHYFEDENKVWIWIADATGHGAPAALLTSAAKSAVSIIENLNLPLKESFEHLNFAICNVSKENMMMTSFVGLIDKKTLDFSYINASHEPSIMIKKSHEISKDNLIFLNENANPRLGESKESKFTSSTVKLSPGDRIVFYTDGVMDVRNLEDKVYGERSFMKGIVSSYNKSRNLGEFFTDYENSLVNFRSDTELIDDVTFCFFEIK
jgi:phosphoserine phosphatase RsbU/P